MDIIIKTMTSYINKTSNNKIKTNQKAQDCKPLKEITLYHSQGICKKHIKK